MKPLTIILLLLITTTLKSQPQLEYISDFASPAFVTRYDFEEDIPMPESGENLIWDYSGYNFTEKYIMTIEDVETTDYDSDFPEATLKIKFGTFVRYVKFDEDEYTYLGSNNTGTSLILTNPHTYYNLPFIYNDSITEEYQYPGEPVSTSQRKYIGYGDLITADGIYEDMILMHVKETIFGDNMEYYQIMSPITYRSILVYWISPELENSFYYDPITLTDIEEPKNDISSFSIFPNPVTDKLNIDINNIQGEYSISLFSIDGRKIKDFMDIDNLNISEIPAGNYFIQLTTSGACFTQKIVKL
ncbi:MAG: T9SS type A sorting domain-containing protein [Chitinophagales bacterium]|nr:T9SS type A sorting domain-containing protein [Chitinophagales bacterium]